MCLVKLYKKLLQQCLSICLLVFCCFATRAQRNNLVLIDSGDTEAAIVRKAASVVPSPRQLRWQQLELVVFFHFGINTFTGNEWGDGREDPRLFNPTKLDARQWVRAVKAAGFKQVIITAKHHDGFCLWPSRYTEYSVKNSAWKNGKGDVVKEVSTACREYGIGFGVYLSPWDRHSPLYGTPAYNDYYANQLTELLTQYGRVDEVWLDGANGEGPNGRKQPYDFNRWYQLIRGLQPNAVIAVMGPDVRWVGTETGYGRETEWSVVPVSAFNTDSIAQRSQQAVAFTPTGDMMGDELGGRPQIIPAKALAWYPAETDVSIRPGWFYHAAEDTAVKTTAQLLDIYFHSVGRNSVLLLNIPPGKDGLLNRADIQRLQEWRKELDKIFRVNLLKGAVVTGKLKAGMQVLTDGHFNTSLACDSEMVFSFRENKTFNLLLLQEDIRKGQQVESFVAEVWINNQWQQIATGTTIGYKRILQTATVTTNRLRLRILMSRAKPVLSEIGIYREPGH